MSQCVKALWFTAQQGVGTSKVLGTSQLHACSSHADPYTDVTVMLKKAHGSTVARVTAKASQDSSGIMQEVGR